MNISEATKERLLSEAKSGRPLLIGHKNGTFLQEGSTINAPIWGGLDRALTFDSKMAHMNSKMLWTVIGFYPLTVSVASAINEQQKP